MLKATPTVGLFAVLAVLYWPDFLYAAGAADDSSVSPRQILERAVQAHGGEQNLAKLRSARRVVKGTFERGSGADGEMRAEMVCQLPDRIRGVQTISLADRDREIRIVKVLSGDQG